MQKQDKNISESYLIKPNYQKTPSFKHSIFTIQPKRKNSKKI